MTGFGEAREEVAGGRLQVQIRSVNHRHFHTRFSLPSAADRWEAPLTRVLRERIGRGHVHLRLDFEPSPESVRPVHVDDARVTAYLAALRAIKERHGLEGAVDLGLLARFGDIFQPQQEELEGVKFDDVAAITRAALDDLVRTREREGAALARDLEAALDAIDSAVDRITERAPERLERERDRLRAAVSELLDEISVDEERLAREIAYLAERWDINEEIVRLKSHLTEFRGTLESADDEPTGKRLSFWVQEMHREANTIGSKANDSEIAAAVVEIKSEIEKLREQVENVE